VGFITSSRHFGERAIKPPVLRVRRPLKSSGPNGVASVKRTQLVGNFVHDFGAHDSIDDDDSVVAEDRADLISRS